MERITTDSGADARRAAARDAEPTENRRAGTVRFGSEGELDNASALAVTAEGWVLAAGRLSATLSANDSATGDLLWLVDTCPLATAMATAGDVVAVVCERPGALAIHDVTTGERLHTISVPGGGATVTVSADGSTVAVSATRDGVSTNDDVTTIVDAATGAVRASFVAPYSWRRTWGTGDSNRLSYLPDLARLTPTGDRLVVAGTMTVWTYDTATGALLNQVATAGRAYAADLSADGSRMLLVVLQPAPGGGIPVASIYDVESGTLDPLDLPSARPSSIFPSGVISPDGKRALISAGGHVDVVSPGAPPISVGAGLGVVVPLGQGRAGVMWSGRTSLIDIATGEELGVSQGQLYYSALMSAIPSLDGETVVATNRDFESIRIAKPSTSDEVRTVRLGEGDELDAPRYVAVSPDGRTAATSLAYSGQVALVDLATQTVLDIVDLNGVGMTYPEDLVFRTNGELVVAGHDNAFRRGILARVSVPRGDILDVIDDGLPTLRNVFASSDGTRVLAHSPADQGRVFVFDVEAGGMRLVSSGDVGGNFHVTLANQTTPFVAATPDGSLVVGNDLEAKIRVYDVNADREHVLNAPSEVIGGIAVSPDGRTALSIGGFALSAYLIDLTGTPSIRHTIRLPDYAFDVVYDADAGQYVVGLLGFPAKTVRVDPETGQTSGFVTHDGIGTIERLAWSSETGLVVSGESNRYEMGGLWTSQGITYFSTQPAGIAVSPSRGEALVAIPGPDELVTVTTGPVAITPPVSVSDLQITTLGNPSSRLSVRLDGPPRPALRVEVVDLLGRVVAQLHDGAFEGYADLEWRDAGPGVYIVRVVGEPVSTRVTVVR